MDVAIFEMTLVMVDVEENTGLTPVECSFRQLNVHSDSIRDVTLSYKLLKGDISRITPEGKCGCQSQQLTKKCECTLSKYVCICCQSDSSVDLLVPTCAFFPP